MGSFSSSSLTLLFYSYHLTEQVIEKIKEAGFTISLAREIKLSKEMAAEFYKEHEGQPYFEQLAENMSRSVLVAYIFLLILSLYKEIAYICMWNSITL